MSLKGADCKLVSVFSISCVLLQTVFPWLLAHGSVAHKISLTVNSTLRAEEKSVIIHEQTKIYRTFESSLQLLAFQSIQLWIFLMHSVDESIVNIHQMTGRIFSFPLKQKTILLVILQKNGGNRLKQIFNLTHIHSF